MKSIINWDTGNWPVFLSGLGYPRWRGERCAIKTASTVYPIILGNVLKIGFAPIFPDTCYHLTHYWPAAADIPV
ncbi:hypothetical protein NP311_14075, partial [Salmonella enterica]|nr:hypothetical protein [Salmonella enterica]MCQ7910739.1 hypothetical protein [Salmonella enterica]MCQ7915387.1 hypothetical protein [Salmonella enterica]